MMYNQAVIRFNSGNYASAIEDLNQVLQINPKIAEAYYNRGLAQNILGNHQLAIEDYTKAIRINSKFVEAYRNRGISNSTLGNYPRAIEDYNTALSLDPSLSEAYILLAKAYSSQKKFKLALNALECNPLFICKNIKFYEIRAFVRHQLKEYEGAIDDYSQVILINPECAEAYYQRGSVYYLDLYDYKQAFKDYSQAIRINPNFAEAYLKRGLARRSAFKDYQGAIEDYNQAIHIDSDYAEAYVNRGLDQFILGNEQTAFEDYSKAISIEPNSPELYFLRGSAFCRSKYTKQASQTAVEDYTEAIKISPYFAEAYSLRGINRYLLGDYKGAVEDLDKAECFVNRPIKFQSNSSYTCILFRAAIKQAFTDLYPAKVHLRGIFRITIKDFQGAIEDFTQFISYNPDFVRLRSFSLENLTWLPELGEGYSWRGLARYLQGDIEGATEDYDQAIDIDQNCASAYEWRGILRYKQGDPHRAIWDLQKAAKLFFEQGDISYYEDCLETIRKLEPPTETLNIHTNLQNLLAPFLEKEIQKLLAPMLEKQLGITSEVLQTRFAQLDNLQHQFVDVQLVLQSHSEQLANLQHKFTDFQQQITETLKSANVNLSSLQTQLDNFASAIAGIPNQLNEAVDMRVAEINQLLKTIQLYQYELVINRDGSRSQLIKAAKEAEYQLLLVCPWLHWGVRWNNNELIHYFRAFLAKNQNGCIDIGWGHYQDIELVKNKSGSIRGRLKAHSKLYSALDNLEKLEMDYQSRFRLKLIGTHEKFLVCDDKFAMLGSHNFLSSGDKSGEREVGIYTTDPRIIQQLKNQFEKAKNLEKDNN
ncbi:MAG: tetratricopeptide repeat protein [Tolypothrix carrinoi HA7290-LM1]|nr:tetratricopeptide repeat protein [Tolypothrix carrinoi HA7290-LM1]